MILFTVFLGKVPSFSQIGYIGWAKNGRVPLRLIMDNVIRVTFQPMLVFNYSASIRHSNRKTLFGVSAAVFPLVSLCFFHEPCCTYYPKYIKMGTSLMLFTFLLFPSACASLSTPLTNALNAVGKISWTLYLNGWVDH